MRRPILLAVAFCLVVAAAPVVQAAPETHRYIVVLDDSVRSAGSVASAHARDHGVQVGHVYGAALKGYSAAMSDTAATRIKNDPRVDYVELDGAVTKVTEQAGATWGLDRVDQRDLPLDGKYVYEPVGSGVTAYIIDSGVSPHADFAPRLATSGIDYIDDDADPADCDGHGTHVAGTVGGATYGIAKGVSLVGVRVLDCNGSGTTSDVIAGVDWVTANRQGPSVANMSLGGGASSSLDQAVSSSIASGVTYAIAAGNGNRAGEGQDACNYSPARVATALTVGATNSSDAKPTWSNYGTCLDLFAPGVGITSTTMDGLTGTWSGTSMATPHVAGVAALYLEGNPGATAAEVADAIRTSATTGKVTSAGAGSPNLLLFSLLTAPVTTEPAPPPPSAITLTASGKKVKGVMTATLTWKGAAGSSVDVFRNGSKIATTDNDGEHLDKVGKGSGTFTYKICEAGTSTCSNEATVVF